MTITLRRIAPGDAAVFDAIAIDVFDEPIHPARLQAYLREPGHLMLLAGANRLSVSRMRHQPARVP